MKKPVSLLLSLLMVISIITSVPITVSAASTSDLTFELNEDGESYSVTDCNEKASGALVIPDTHNGLLVTNIGEHAFDSCKNLTEVKIPDSVIIIDEYAFHFCTSLKSISIGEGVTEIGDRAFYGCSSLESFIFPDSVTSIGWCAFSGCNSLTSLAIPDSVTSIKSSAFGYCTNLNTIIIGNGITSLYRVLDNCTNLKNVVIGDGVTNIEFGFEDCENLESVTFGSNVSYIRPNAFSSCENLKEININKKNKSYSSVDGVLFNKDKTTIITYPKGKITTKYIIPESVTIIGDSAFSGCQNLKSIAIPDTVIDIGSSAFDGCTSIKSVTIPDSVTNLGYFAFGGCENLKSVKIGNGVTKIDFGAFQGCENLETVIIGSSVNSIGRTAFSGCTNLTSITIPDSVKYIEYSCFQDCTNLEEIKLSDNIVKIGENTFLGTKYYNNSANWKNGFLYIGNHLIKAPVSVDGTYVVKKGTKTIADECFLNCTELEGITIPDGLAGVGYNAFSGCVNLKNVDLPQSVTYIGTYAFDCCKSLESVELPDKAERLGAGAFQHCVNLKKVSVPKGITTLEFATFNSCESIEKIEIPSTVTKIAYMSFSDCSSLKSVKIPNSVKSIGSGVFNNCENLKSVYIPKSVEDLSWPGLGYYNDVETGERMKITGFTVVGSKGSQAETYAKENGFTFVEIKKPTKPMLKKVSNIDGNVKVTWGTVKGADLYRIYRMVSGGEYEYIGSTANTSYTDKKAPAGKTCRYKIKAKNEAGYSEYSASIAIKHIDEPTLKSIENSAYGVLIKWDKVTGAEKYNVYRKVSGGEYKYIGATDKAYYTDKTAESGTKYYYAIRAKRDDSISSQSASLSKYYLADPTLNTPSSTTKGIGLKWSQVEGAEGYMVYRKTADGSYTRIATEKGVSNVTFRDTTAKKGTKYYYKVKAYYSKTYSSYSNTKAITDKY